MRTFLARLRLQLWTFRVLVGSGMIALLRPDKYLAMGRVIKEQGTNATTGMSLAAVRRPDGTALVDELGSLTWVELEARSQALAVGLAALVDGPVETVALLARNHRGFVETLNASARLGAQCLLLNTGFSGPQLADVMLASGARSSSTTRSSTASSPTPASGSGTGRGRRLDRRRPDGRTTVEGLIGQHLGEKPPSPPRPGRVILLTSGTTGTPKGAKRGGGGADELAAMLARIPWKAEETVVVAAPMFHAWGFGQLVIGATMTCTVVMRRRFDPEATLALVDEHRARGLWVVPVMLERIVDLPAEVLDTYSLSSLAFTSASGSRMRPDAVIAYMDRFGDHVYNSYNATEAGQITVAGPDDLRVAPDTAGRPVPGTILRIVDDEWHDVPTGEVGRITVKSASAFDGYTSGDSKQFHEGFMVSGDVGRLDEEGRLFVVGRDDDMIVSGGENVYPLEVEKLLGEHAAVREVVVVGVDDDSFGQRLAAYVVLAPGAEASVDELKAHVKAELAGYKVPRDVVFIDELPRNASGKVMKRELPSA